MFKKLNGFLLTLLVINFLTPEATAQIVDSNSVSKTQVILLGTGNPYPNPDRSGPATAVVYNGRFFLFDAGAGVMRQINKAGLPISGPEATFITHLHSDHTLGYPDLILTSWVMRRDKHLQVYGPHGLQSMTDYILKAYSEDINIRIEGLEKEVPDWYKADVHEIDPGVVYDSGGVKITAFHVLHGTWKEAYGYRIDTPDRSIVISGDTRPCQALIDVSKGVDILIHEVHPSSLVKPEKRPGGEYWPEYQKQFHTSDVELGEIAKQSEPKLLILYHISRVNDKIEKELLGNIRKSGFDGKIVVGKDMDIF
jgi:ribonuclease BN (tRNA processing enzyme)